MFEYPPASICIPRHSYPHLGILLFDISFQSIHQHPANTGSAQVGSAPRSIPSESMLPSGSLCSPQSSSSSCHCHCPRSIHPVLIYILLPLHLIALSVHCASEGIGRTTHVNTIDIMVPTRHKHHSRPPPSNSFLSHMLRCLY